MTPPTSENKFKISYILLECEHYYRSKRTVYFETQISPQ